MEAARHVRPTPSRWRSFLTAAWLGWQIESNWTDPFLFAIYSVIKPIASASILVVIYAIITHGNFKAPMFPWIFLGAALYQYVGAIMTGLSWTVVDDRERYRMLKYVYAVPTPFPLYLLGRGISRLVTGSFSVWITVLFGVLFLKVPLTAAHFHPWMFLAGLVLGIGMLAAMGMVLGSVVLLFTSNNDQMGEATAGALYLFSAAAFPIAVMPLWLQPVARALPLSYWLELMRRSMLGSPPREFATFAGWSEGQLLFSLVLWTAGLSVLASLTLRVCIHFARERGLLDRVSNY